MAEPRKRPGDVTGRNAEILAAKAAEEGKIRDKEMTLMTLASKAEKLEPTDLTHREVAVADLSPVTVESTKPVKIRLNSTLEHVTIGHGNDYTFNEGEVYIVPKNVADHLEAKGYVWH